MNDAKKNSIYNKNNDNHFYEKIFDRYFILRFSALLFISFRKKYILTKNEQNYNIVCKSMFVDLDGRSGTRYEYQNVYNSIV